MFELENTWHIVALVAAIAVLRVVYSVWKSAPYRPAMLELFDSGLIAFALVFVVIRPFVVQAFFIPSASMEPTLYGHDKGKPVATQPGMTYTNTVHDRILVNKFIYRLRPPRRGDIVVFRAPADAGVPNDHTDYIKRVIGLPGDRIMIRNGEGVFINGRKLKEPYIRDGSQLVDYNLYVLDGRVEVDERYSLAAGARPLRIGRGMYFVMGDNRQDSNDSHRWGPLRGRSILGKAMLIFWPLGRLSLVH